MIRRIQNLPVRTAGFLQIDSVRFFVLVEKKKLIYLMGVVLLIITYFMSGEIAQTVGKETAEEKGKFTVIIDAGHGGMDGGAVSVLGDSEKYINLDIAKKLKCLLEEKGVNVVMTRDSDNGLYAEGDSNKKRADMAKRCEIINESKGDLMISIHQNIYRSEGVKGAQFFYYKGSESGEKLACILQEEIRKLDKTNERVAKENDSYYVLKNSKCTSVMAECGFLSNYEEAKLLSTEDYREKVAGVLCDGIMKFLEEKE